jgi:hypothetical protein
MLSELSRDPAEDYRKCKAKKLDDVVVMLKNPLLTFTKNSTDI